MSFNDKNASHKALIYFQDGNQRTFYSWDFAYKGAKERDPDLGKRRLRNYINKAGKKIKTAIIVCTISGDEVEKYVEGEKKELEYGN